MATVPEAVACRLPADGHRPARVADGPSIESALAHMPDDELHALLRDGTPADVADVLLARPEATRRSLAAAVRGYPTLAVPDLSGIDRPEAAPPGGPLPSAAPPGGPLPSAALPEAALLVAGAACLPRADAVVSWLRSRRFQQVPTQETLDQLVRVLTAPGRPRPASVAAVFADRMRPRPAWPGEWPVARAVLLAAGTPPPPTDAVLRAWIRGHAGDPATLADRLSADPWLDHFLPHLLHSPGLDRAWPPALAGLTETGRVDRNHLLRLTLHRLRAGGSPAALRPATATHDLLSPTAEEVRRHRKDYLALLDSPQAALARRALRALEEPDPAAIEPARSPEDLVAAAVEPERSGMAGPSSPQPERSTAPEPNGSDKPTPAIAQTALSTAPTSDQNEEPAPQTEQSGAPTAPEADRSDQPAPPTARIGAPTSPEADRSDQPAPPTAQIGAPTAPEADWRDQPAPPPTQTEPHADRTEGPAPATTEPDLPQDTAGDGSGGVARPPRFPAAPVPAAADAMPPPFESMAGLVAELAVRVVGPVEPVGLERILAGLVAFAQSGREELVAAVSPLADSAVPPFDELLGTLVRPGRAVRARPAGPLSGMVTARMREVGRQLATVPPPALLATPVSTDGSVSAARLLFRLHAAERDGWQPGPYDLAQALLRLPTTVDPAVVTAAERLTSPAGRRFAAWLRGGGLPPVTGTVAAGPVRRATYVPPQAPVLPQEFHAAPAPDGVAPMLHETTPAPTVDTILGGLLAPPPAEPGEPAPPEMRCWPLVLPHHRELVAAHCAPFLTVAHEDDAIGDVVRGLARCGGPFGAATALVLARGLVSAGDELRRGAADAALHLAGSTGLDAALVGRELRALVTADAGLIGPAARGLRWIGEGQGWHVAWAVAYAVLPVLSRQRPEPGGLAELRAVAADAAEVIGAHAELPASGLPASGLPASELPASGLPTSGLPTSG